MASSGRVSIKTIREALQVCLPDCRWDLKKHRWHIYPPAGGAPYHLPRGEHGGGQRAEIERGHIKRMSRQFGVLECMKGQISGL